MKNENIDDLYRCKSNKIVKSRTISLNVMLWRILKPYVKIGKNEYNWVQDGNAHACTRRDSVSV